MQRIVLASAAGLLFAVTGDGAPRAGLTEAGYTSRPDPREVVDALVGPFREGKKNLIGQMAEP